MVASCYILGILISVIESLLLLAEFNSAEGRARN